MSFTLSDNTNKEKDGLFCSVRICSIMEVRLMIKTNKEILMKNILVPLFVNRFEHDLCQGILAVQVVLAGRMQQMSGSTVDTASRLRFIKVLQSIYFNVTLPKRNEVMPWTVFAKDLDNVEIGLPDKSNSSNLLCRTNELE